MQFQLFVALFLVVTSEAANLTCPTDPITSKTPTGAFPATGFSVFPENYRCSIEFEIPSGQVVEFIVKTNVTSEYGDSLLIRDAVSTVYEMDSSVSLFYAPANNAKLYITTKTATSYFYFNWKYIDVTDFKRIQNPTGTILPMNLTQGSYYQFTSAKSRVAFHTGNLKNNLDPGLSQIHVYDGENLNAKYIGTLFQFLQTNTLSASSGNSLVLVNYYGTESLSYGIANDYSAVFSYDSYVLSILSKDVDYSGLFHVTDRFESAVTFYCIDSDETYIADLTMADRSNGGQAVRFKPRTPTEVYTNLLVYNTGDRIAQSLPQQIMTNIFTVTMYQCDLRLGLVSGPLFLWTTAAPGRQGMIYSPSNWNPTLPITPQYFTNITTKENTEFLFNIPFVLVKPGEKIRVEIGYPDGKNVSVEFDKTLNDTGTRAAYGTYMAITFTGTTVDSSFKMSFSVGEESVPVTTASPLMTTTKSSKTADLTCPKGPVTSKTPNGAFPATGISPFPANYGCAIEFDIPDGQIIKFMSQSNAVNENVDRMTIMDSAGTLYEMASGEALLYTPANYSKLWIQTKTDTASFYISWQYIDVSKYTKMWNPTGTILPLNLTSNSYYQFSSNQSQVVFHIGNLDRTNDSSLFNIYVYDGEDLNSRYIGNLLHLIGKPTPTGSTRNSLVLVNYYGSKSKSWGIANDWSAIAPYKDYNLFIMSQGIDYTYNAYIPDGLQSAVTFYCIDSSESYITSLTLKDRNNGRQFLAFQPLTPTKNYPQLLTYNVNTQISQSLPQQILSNTFTMVLYHCETQLTISSGPLFIWTLAVPGRAGQIMSPSAWNPLTFNQKPYSTNFTSTQKLKFTFNFGYLIINNPAEQIDIEIGSSDSQPFSLRFNHTGVNIGTQEAYGTYMSTSFTGKTSIITAQWFYNCLIIDVYQFVPSPFVLVMGFITKIIDPVYLYIGNYCATSNTLGSCLTLFCNRLFKIMSLYNSKKSIFKWLFEIIVYLGVYGFAVSVVPSMASGIPWDQTRAKDFYRNISPTRFYPDTIMNSNVIIISDPERTGNTKSIKYNLIHISVVTIIIVTSAKLAIWMLQSKMKSKNESEKTKKMHKNFNDRSIFQALIQFLFSTIPFTIVNCLLYFNIIIPEVSYFADIMAELMPLACVLTLFVFYEPYQHFLLVKVGVRHDTCNILSTTGAIEKGGGVKFSQHIIH